LLDAALHAIGLTGDADRSGALPSAWTGVRLHASGATALRVRLTPATSDETPNGVAGGVALAVADGAGAPVATVDSLVLRPAATLTRQRQDRDALFGVDWVAVPPAGGTAPTTRWADLETLTRQGTADLADFVVVPCPATAASDPVTAAHEAAHRALHTIQTWLADERYETARLAVATSGAIATAAEDDVRDLAQAAVWGLVRSAQSENPDRIVLVDLDDEAASLDALPSALATGEPQLALRSGEIHVPRLARAAGHSTADGDPGFGTGAVLVTG
ncbi:SpnB-like Rossmann fold domain-containing protein, partial [Streptomyces silvensis]|uniref:SpnB-like Rossmann fold domain-containing protein n=1 Tax=Streptomyces silvensis TaxID=1765722 RepID=UPI00321F7896